MRSYGVDSKNRLVFRIDSQACRARRVRAHSLIAWRKEWKFARRPGLFQINTTLQIVNPFVQAPGRCERSWRTRNVIRKLVLSSLLLFFPPVAWEADADAETRSWCLLAQLACDLTSLGDGSSGFSAPGRATATLYNKKAWRFYNPWGKWASNGSSVCEICSIVSVKPELWLCTSGASSSRRAATQSEVLATVLTFSLLTAFNTPAVYEQACINSASFSRIVQHTHANITETWHLRYFPHSSSRYAVQSVTSGAAEFNGTWEVFFETHFFPPNGLDINTVLFLVIADKTWTKMSENAPTRSLDEIDLAALRVRDT